MIHRYSAIFRIREVSRIVIIKDVNRSILAGVPSFVQPQVCAGPATIVHHWKQDLRDSIC
jgi:hypothetical protein